MTAGTEQHDQSRGVLGEIPSVALSAVHAVVVAASTSRKMHLKPVVEATPHARATKQSK